MDWLGTEPGSPQWEACDWAMAQPACSVVRAHLTEDVVLYSVPGWRFRVCCLNCKFGILLKLANLEYCWSSLFMLWSCLQYELPRVWRSQDPTLHTFPISALSTVNQAGEPCQNKPLVWRCRSIWWTCVKEETAAWRTCFSTSCIQSTFWTAAANTLRCSNNLYWQLSTVGLRKPGLLPSSVTKHLIWWPPYIQLFSVYSQYKSLFLKADTYLLSEFFG